MTKSTSPPDVRHVAIIGGGISGLSAAHRIFELAPETQVTVFEARERAGGVLNTEIRDGFEIEQSADNFITTVPWGLNLCKRLGLESDVVTTTPAHRQTFVVWKNRLCKLPDGFMMMAPTRWMPMAFTPLLSPWGKLRAAMEVLVPRRKKTVGVENGEDDESMESFAVRRLGRETYERIIEPLVSGVYAADMKKLSVRATLARFLEMEEKHRSLILAMQIQKWKMKKFRKESGPRYSMFVTVKGGLRRITEEIIKKLPDGIVKTGCPVQKIRFLAENGSENTENIENTHSGKWEITAEMNGAPKAEVFDAVIIATQSHAAAKLMENAANEGNTPGELRELAGVLGEIEHTGTAVMTVAYRRDQITHPLDGMGAVVPGVEKSPILALSFSSEKYPHRAPEDYSLFRVFAGGARNPAMAEKSDEEIQAILLPEVAKILGISGEPCMISISRWPLTMPQYHMGHLGRVAKIEKIVGDFPSLAIAGNEFHGVGIPQCIHTGELAAEKVLGVKVEKSPEPPTWAR